MKKIILTVSLVYTIWLCSLQSLVPLSIQKEELCVYIAIRQIAENLEKEFGKDCFSMLDNFSGMPLDIKTGLVLCIHEENDMSYTVTLVTPWGTVPACGGARTFTDVELLKILNHIKIKNIFSESDNETILRIDAAYYKCPEVTFYETDMAKERKELSSEIEKYYKEKWQKMVHLYNIMKLCVFLQVEHNSVT
ncbi:MAG: hypothetical protein K2X90_00385 [Candidatus Babeliaceae bacterium]|nr:hypothetical protein [Candidatus Babeliaceae bacterium]